MKLDFSRAAKCFCACFGVDIWNIPEVNGYKHSFVYIDYFPKWSEAKPLEDKLAESVSLFLYEIICRHGYLRIQINHQGREFVNDFITKLHEMNGVDKRINSTIQHPQANGHCERQNRTIKDSLVKVFDARLFDYSPVQNNNGGKGGGGTNKSGGIWKLLSVKSGNLLSLIMGIALAKSWSTRGASHHPALIGSCQTISHTCLLSLKWD